MHSFSHQHVCHQNRRRTRKLQPVYIREISDKTAQRIYPFSVCSNVVHQHTSYSRKHEAGLLHDVVSHRHQGMKSVAVPEQACRRRSFVIDRNGAVKVEVRVGKLTQVERFRVFSHGCKQTVFVVYSAAEHVSDKLHAIEKHKHRDSQIGGHRRVTSGAIQVGHKIFERIEDYDVSMQRNQIARVLVQKHKGSLDSVS
ncbi:hypothetical protein CLUG_04983 [Clavispora lusitaniae ATCC 42720]|uniref:Uncharacterized protein n=1 Tax=Clavispora lusitaniae (strain ATCC 42720) TaxID=306902 RepID=C4YA45_CLAL4|nr:uncharacterized protein CLUG_04983 [Clavispora lusitaniae ATCC 42720]EEQ40855.1 hypothetical protein CLUG_04983 [Clavispora lusitaniae ATCC 42720]